ncbi:uncharacterized protein LOC124167648 [Ischnura elegans]|uniref:uncharacterized protein LOC124167648 n=1 Tax=Ischnura elegans TaxID=197161 RepID=UPI001ED89966|nr:uncharacterized protein LOC124167648 [Ischnura elegans]
MKRPGEFPILQETLFGWILAGVIPSNNNDTSSFQPQQIASHCLQVSLEDLIQEFWNIESIQTPTLTSEERECERHFINHTRRQEDGRFVVKLPTKMDPMVLGKSRHTALGRLLQIERKMNKNVDLFTSYHEFMREYLELGHMQHQVQQSQESSFYIPHHPVFKASSSTTSMRVVFDASTKTTSGLSLNDILMVGHSTQQDLYCIILRFRTHQIAMVADIEKMYRQILVHPDDRKLQRILWRKSTQDEVEEYHLTTVTYGTASAPFLATMCLEQLAQENEENHPSISKIIHEDFYVDDLLSGASTLLEALEFYKELTSVLRTAGFSLRKWSTNSPELLANIPLHLQETKLQSSLGHGVVTALGLHWDPASDQFQIKSNLALPNHNLVVTGATKRKVMSIIATIFDPLGLISPAVVSYKIFLQTLWQEGIDWDEELTPSLSSTWTKLFEQIPILTKITIDRKAVCDHDTTLHHKDTSKIKFDAQPNLEIHGFCDSSQRAYGACLCLRWQQQQQRLQHFWNRWTKDYLQDLQQRRRWRQTYPDYQPGMISALLIYSYTFLAACAYS